MTIQQPYANNQETKQGVNLKLIVFYTNLGPHNPNQLLLN